MSNIVNNDIRWGLFGLTINESYISYNACERYTDDEDYNFDPKEEPNKIDKIDILQNCINKVERSINWSKYEEIRGHIEECINDYANLYYKIEEDEKEDEETNEEKEEKQDETVEQNQGETVEKNQDKPIEQNHEEGGEKKKQPKKRAKSNSKKFSCSCGVSINIKSKKRHMTSKKHLKYINSNTHKN